MSSFSVCWNRRRLAWRRHSERIVAAGGDLVQARADRGRPALRIVGRLGTILEDEIDSVPPAMRSGIRCGASWASCGD
jgi:hypothetical protein